MTVQSQPQRINPLADERFQAIRTALEQKGFTPQHQRVDDSLYALKKGVDISGNALTLKVEFDLKDGKIEALFSQTGRTSERLEPFEAIHAFDSAQHLFMYSDNENSDE